jgi:hypothetical protein
MKLTSRLTRILDTLGMLGLLMRSRRVSNFDETSANREWGPAIEGFALSILASPDTAGPEEPVKLLLALRNGDGREIQAAVPAWLSYFELRIAGPTGALAERTAYGLAVLSSSADSSMIVVFSPERPQYVEFPLSDIYGMTAPGTYRVSASCPVPASASGAKCQSNEVMIERRSERY